MAVPRSRRVLHSYWTATRRLSLLWPDAATAAAAAAQPPHLGVALRWLVLSPAQSHLVMWHVTASLHTIHTHASIAIYTHTLSVGASAFLLLSCYCCSLFIWFYLCENNKNLIFLFRRWLELASLRFSSPVCCVSILLPYSLALDAVLTAHSGQRRYYRKEIYKEIYSLFYLISPCSERIFWGRRIQRLLKCVNSELSLNRGMLTLISDLLITRVLLGWAADNTQS